MRYVVDASPDRASTDGFTWLRDGEANPVIHPEALNVFSTSGFCSSHSISFANGSLSLHCPGFILPLLPTCPSHSAFGIPDEWSDLWAAWDLVTLDMFMSRALHEPNTEPKNFTLIFDRGIDLMWMILSTITGTRECLRKTRNDHHLVQSSPVHLPRSYAISPFEALQRLSRMATISVTAASRGWHWRSSPSWVHYSSLGGTRGTAEHSSTSTVTVGPARVTLGYDDCESEDFSPDVAGIVDVHAFGWGNESLTCFEEVKQVKIERKPVTNAGFLTICKGNKQVGLPVSWMEDTGEIKFSIAFRASVAYLFPV
ncbi:hypothetical protein EV401DRAFT_1895129 [Pisolithus croceorrhizus]|nr:hypothetical protein EV401DRAFT_1895129 [Pisolithus croceorrhizus]